MGEASELHDVVVIVDPQCGRRLEQVAASLRQAGMRVDQMLEGIRMISGAVATENEAALKSVPGVQDVERSRSYGLE